MKENERGNEMIGWLEKRIHGWLDQPPCSFFRVCYSSVLACPFVEEWRRNLEPSPVFFSTLTTTNVERKNNLTFSRNIWTILRAHTEWSVPNETQDGRLGTTPSFFLLLKHFFGWEMTAGKTGPTKKKKWRTQHEQTRTFGWSLDVRERWQSFLYNSLLALVYLFIVIALFLKELHKLKQEGNVREGKVP